VARKVRVEFPGAIYHVMMRGNERARIFRGTKDYSLFLEALDQGRERFGVDIHAYCLMPNQQFRGQSLTINKRLDGIL